MCVCRWGLHSSLFLLCFRTWPTWLVKREQPNAEYQELTTFFENYVGLSWLTLTVEPGLDEWIDVDRGNRSCAVISAAELVSFYTVTIKSSVQSVCVCVMCFEDIVSLSWTLPVSCALNDNRNLKLKHDKQLDSSSQTRTLVTEHCQLCGVVATVYDRK